MAFLRTVAQISNSLSWDRSIWDYIRVRRMVGRFLRNRRLQLWTTPLHSKHYLNVGCGGGPHPDFINLDYGWIRGLDLCWDITKGLPIKEGFIRGIFTEHVLEHIPFEDCGKILAEFRRVLEPGGTLRIIVPDAELYLDAYQRGKLGERINMPDGTPASPEGHFDVTPMMVINRIFRGHGHQYAYDFRTLKMMLENAGFVGVEKATFGNGRDKCLLIDLARRAYESLYVEASVP